MNVSIVFDSMTHAMKLRNLLQDNDISSYINKCDDECSCCYCVNISSDNFETVMSIIKEKSIPFRRVL